MLTRDLWDEIKSKWPGAYWDDWLREPEQRKNRDCIRPEISRTFTFGKEGSSMGQFYEKHLANIKLNSVVVDWRSKDFSYLAKVSINYILNNYVIILHEKDFFDKEFDKEISSCTEISDTYEIDTLHDKNLLLYYDSPEKFTLIADSLGVMSDHKVCLFPFLIGNIF
jgi:alpha-1,3-mannosyl-glycoprotein beta-1,2-N-acetylglucosaminyltransferase